MSQPFDFERYWQAKLASCLDTLGEDLREKVMAGGQELSAESSNAEVIAWSQSAMQRLRDLAGEESARQIMTGCACEYPSAELQEIRQVYAANGDLDQAIAMLQEKFESFLKNVLQLSDELIEEVVSRNMGLAGIRQDEHTIIATKIPKSGCLVQYFQESDPLKKRQYYCHCPRIRKVLETSETLDPVYCYCGAGYYKKLWEEITGESVEVKVLESVLMGDEVCKIAIHLP
jgi:hypothetical protein